MRKKFSLPRSVTPKPVPPPSVTALYQEVIRLAAAEFRHNAERFKDHPAPGGGLGFQCRLGCTACCHHLFEINLLEAIMISARSKPCCLNNKPCSARGLADTMRNDGNRWRNAPAE